MRLIIRETSKLNVLADATGGQALKVEGNWYVRPDAVSQDRLAVTTREYVCPYKDRCFYVDAVIGARRIERVAWIYDESKPGWEHIKGRYGFYSGVAATRLGKTAEEIF